MSRHKRLTYRTWHKADLLNLFMARIPAPTPFHGEILQFLEFTSITALLFWGCLPLATLPLHTRWITPRDGPNYSRILVKISAIFQNLSSKCLSEIFLPVFFNESILVRKSSLNEESVDP